ncbi:MAG: hypothetical protein KF832_20420, partial [Caldilineaceae bacterium]|nr:hypothetical protein [Caldilineaceae bacterium]
SGVISAFSFGQAISFTVWLCIRRSQVSFWFGCFEGQAVISGKTFHGIDEYSFAELSAVSICGIMLGYECKASPHPPSDFCPA